MSPRRHRGVILARARGVGRIPAPDEATRADSRRLECTKHRGSGSVAAAAGHLQELLALWQDPRLIRTSLACNRQRKHACGDARGTARVSLDGPTIREAVPGGHHDGCHRGHSRARRQGIDRNWRSAASPGSPGACSVPRGARHCGAERPGLARTKKERMHGCSRLLGAFVGVSKAPLGRCGQFCGSRSVTRPPRLRPTTTGRQWFGHTDNYIAVYTSGSELLNRVTPVQLGEVYDDGVWGCIPGEAV